MGGHLLDNLSFYFSWAWQDFDYKGDDETGHTSVDQRAKHRIGAGLRYSLLENTMLLLDYSYQSDELTEIWEEEEINGELVDVFTGEYQEIPAYHLFDIGVRQTLFNKAGWFREGVLSVYVKNLFDEEYFNATGWPGLDRTYGASFSVKL